MVCPQCRDGDHDHRYDTQHPHQNYRGCACQHQPRKGRVSEEGVSNE